MLPAFIQPIRPQRRSTPFADADWLFEIKHDGFRALAYIENGVSRLVSRNAHTYRRFATLCVSIARELRVKNAVLDGEIVCLDPDGRSNFKRLLYRRGEPHFYAFDALWLNNRDLRRKPLVERKALLRRLVPPQPSSVLYVDHIGGDGVILYDAACALDLEGVVAKRRSSTYDENAGWLKIRNRAYSQIVGRDELFERRAATA